MTSFGSRHDWGTGSDFATATNAACWMRGCSGGEGWAARLVSETSAVGSGRWDDYYGCSLT